MKYYIKIIAIALILFCWSYLSFYDNKEILKSDVYGVYTSIVQVTYYIFDLYFYWALLILLLIVQIKFRLKPAVLIIVGFYLTVVTGFFDIVADANHAEIFARTSLVFWGYGLFLLLVDKIFKKNDK